MSPAPDMLDRFAVALMRPGAAPPQGLCAARAPDMAARFNVYRNNVFAGLIEALASAYPVTARLVGEEFFTIMAREFIIAHPPASPVLLEFGADLPEFLARFPPAAALAYLPDMARFEAAWLGAFHAADAAPLAAADFAAIAPERMAALRLDLAPAARALSSPWPLLHIWQAHQGETEPEFIDIERPGGDLLITRPAYEVLISPLPPGGADFAAALVRGEALGRAAEAARCADARFDLTAALAALIRGGACSHLSLTAKP